MKTLRVYWWNKGPGRGNFGDELGPAIVRVLSRRRIEWASPEQAELISIGSVLEPWFWKNRSAADFNGIIWGAGRMHGKQPFSVNPASVALIRGPLSVQQLDGLSSQLVPTGEPGLLAELFVKSNHKRYSLGIVPHWSHRQEPIWREITDSSPRVCLIGPCSGYEKVIQSIAECEAIATTSLHAIIVADALGVPNVWLSLENDRSKETQAPFKFADYYASLGLAPPKQFEIKFGLTVSQISKVAELNGTKMLDDVKQKIWDSFPL